MPDSSPLRKRSSDSICGSNQKCRFRPRFFARYIAISARCASVSAVWVSVSPGSVAVVAMPSETVVSTRMPLSSTGADTASIRLAAKLSTRSRACGSYDNAHRNSSPPMRAIRPSGGNSALIRCAVAASTQSPIWCPFRSLISLKLSKSIMNSASSCPRSRVTARRCSIAGMPLRRLRQPVSGSISANARASSSAFRRTSISRCKSLYRRQPNSSRAMFSSTALVSSISGAAPVPIHARTILGITEPPVPTNMITAAKAMPSATTSRSAFASRREDW